MLRIQPATDIVAELNAKLKLGEERRAPLGRQRLCELGARVDAELPKTLRCHQGDGLRIPGIRSPGDDGHDPGMSDEQCALRGYV